MAKRPVNYADPRIHHAPNALSEVARERVHDWPTDPWPDEAEILRRIEVMRVDVTDVIFGGVRPTFDD